MILCALRPNRASAFSLNYRQYWAEEDDPRKTTTGRGAEKMQRTTWTNDNLTTRTYTRAEVALPRRGKRDPLSSRSPSTEEGPAGNVRPGLPPPKRGGGLPPQEAPEEACTAPHAAPAGIIQIRVRGRPHNNPPPPGRSYCSFPLEDTRSTHAGTTTSRYILLLDAALVQATRAPTGRASKIRSILRTRLCVTHSVATALVLPLELKQNVREKEIISRIHNSYLFLKTSSSKTHDFPPPYEDPHGLPAA